MVSKIIACADLHIRNLRRIEEYQEQFSKFIEDCRKTAEEERGGAAIVIAGDIFHNKLDISAEGYALAAWFFRQLDDIAPTFVIAGNHDMSRNLERLDPLSMLFSVSPFKNVHYLDKELGYQSDCFVYENITFALYSVFDNFTRPNIEEYKISNPENKIVGLFHGDINGGKSDAGYICDNGLETSMFDGCDFVIAGHIHKRQELTYNGIPIVYCGSLIQQNHGENVSGHGYVVWNVEDETFSSVDIENGDFGFYTFNIEKGEDIDEDKEQVINL